MDMHTKAEKVTGSVSIWAVPKEAYQIQPGDRPFNYELSTNSTYHWRTGAVCVHTTDVEVALPGGINLYIKAIETLETAKKAALDEYVRKETEINKQIEQLKMLTHMPDVAPVREESIIDILMRRDNMDRAEAEDRLRMAREQVAEGEDPEDVLREEFGLEPDYIFELLGDI